MNCIENFLPAIFTLLGVAMGSLITMYVSSKNREQTKNLFSLERKDKFRMIAIEKRLEAHQKALSYWYELRDIIHEPNEEKRNDILEKAHNFWINNCLYLEKETQKRFSEAILIVKQHKTNLQIMRQEKDEKNRKEFMDNINNNWNRFNDLYDFIFSEIELVPIKSEFEEFNPLSKEESK